MTNKILSDFFYGNINPNEKQFDRDSEYGKTADKLLKIENDLKAMLDEDALKLYEKQVRLDGEITGMTAEAYFIDGFRTGFRMAVAVLYDGEKTFLEEYSDQA